MSIVRVALECPLKVTIEVRTYVPAICGEKVGFTVNSVRPLKDVGVTDPLPLDIIGIVAPAGKDLITVEIVAEFNKEFATYPNVTVPTN